MSHVVVVGAINVDLTLRVDAAPAAGESVLARDVREAMGGKGGNQAVQVARCGAPVHLVGAVGDDPAGRSALRALRAAGVGLAHVARRPDTGTGLGIVLVDRSAENRIVVAPRANASLTDADVAAAERRIARAAAVLVSLEVPVAAATAAVALARRHGVPTLTNGSPAGAVTDDLLAGTDHLIVNETELSALAGPPTGPADDPASWARPAGSLLDRGPRTVVLTRGAAGAVVVTGTGATVVPARRVAAVDPTGAGDALAGTVAGCLARGTPLIVAVRAGVVAGSLAVGTPGAQPSLPDWSAIRAALDHRPGGPA
jgi:ribokinase